MTDVQDKKIHDLETRVAQLEVDLEKAQRSRLLHDNAAKNAKKEIRALKQIEVILDGVPVETLADLRQRAIDMARAELADETSFTIRRMDCQDGDLVAILYDPDVVTQDMRDQIHRSLDELCDWFEKKGKRAVDFLILPMGYSVEKADGHVLERLGLLRSQDATRVTLAAIDLVKVLRQDDRGYHAEDAALEDLEAALNEAGAEDQDRIDVNRLRNVAQAAAVWLASSNPGKPLSNQLEMNLHSALLRVGINIETGQGIKTTT